LTWATLRVLRALLWRFHGADGGGRCFPSYERIAAAAKCARSSVAIALQALEEAGILTWVNRIARIRRQERDLFGHWVTVLEVVRTSNAYRFLDPLAAMRSVRTILTEAAARALDAALFSAVAADATRPAGILNNVVPITPATGGGLPATVADIEAIVAAITSNGGGRGGILLFLPPAKIVGLALQSPGFTELNTIELVPCVAHRRSRAL